MSELRERLSNILATQAEGRAERVEANASTDARSLADLARRRYRETEQAKTDAAADKQAQQDTLRAEFLRRVAARGMVELPGLLAEKWELPQEHPFITDLDWQLVDESYVGATFTEEGDGAIEVQAAPGKRLDEVYETTIEGHRIRATVSRANDVPPMLLVSGLTRDTSLGLMDLAALGEFLLEPEETDTTPTE